MVYFLICGVWRVCSGTVRAGVEYRRYFDEIVAIYTIIFHDIFSHPMPHHSDCSVITARNLTAVKRTVSAGARELEPPPQYNCEAPCLIYTGRPGGSPQRGPGAEALVRVLGGFAR